MVQGEICSCHSSTKAWDYLAEKSWQCVFTIRRGTIAVPLIISILHLGSTSMNITYFSFMYYLKKMLDKPTH